MKRILFVALAIAMAVALVACNDSRESNDNVESFLLTAEEIRLRNNLHTNSEQLVIKNNSPGIDTYTVYSLNGDYVTGCKGYVFFPSYYSNKEIADECKSLNDTLKTYPNSFVKRYVQSGKVVIIEFYEKHWKGFTKAEMISSQAYLGGKIVY